MRRLRCARRADGLALLAIWLLILAFFWRLVTPDLAARQYYVTGDFTWKQQAQDVVTARAWAAGQLPLWNPSIYGGQPIAADPGVGLFYPLDLLTTVTAGPDGVSLLRMEQRVVLDFLLAATLTYAFLRAVSRSAVAGLGGTLLFTFGGYLTSYPPHQLDILETGTWLPLALLAVRGVLGPASTAARRRCWALVGTVALTLTFLAGHPQTALLVVDAVAAYAVYLGLRHGTWRTGWPSAACSALAALGLAAAQLLPALEFFPLSNRTAIPAAAAELGIPTRYLPGMLLPHYGPEAALYVGGGLLLAFAGIVVTRRHEGWFWAGLGLAALLLSLGGQTPLYPVFAHLGFGLIRVQSRAIFLTSFAAAVLATGALASCRRRAGQLLCCAVAVAVACAPAVTLLLHRAGDPQAAGHGDAPWLLRIGLAAAVVLAAAAGWLAGRPRGTPARWAAAPVLALVALLAADGMAVNWNNNLTPAPPPAADGLPSTIAALQAMPGPFRIATDGDQLIPADDLGKYQLATDQGYNDFRLAAVDDLLTAPNLWRAWQLLDVHEFLTTRTFGVPFTLQHSEHGVHTYAVGGMLPDVWAVWRYTVAPDQRAALAAVLAPTFDPGQTVVLDRPPDRPIPPLPQHAQQITERVRSPEEVVITAVVDRPALLVRSAAAYPGWGATVDGRPAPLLRADAALQAVAIPAGAHTVVFRFDPWSVKLGVALSLLSLPGCLLGWWRLRRPAARHREGE